MAVAGEAHGSEWQGCLSLQRKRPGALPLRLPPSSSILHSVVIMQGRGVPTREPRLGSPWAIKIQGQVDVGRGN